MPWLVRLYTDTAEQMEKIGALLFPQGAIQYEEKKTKIMRGSPEMHYFVAAIGTGDAWHESEAIPYLKKVKAAVRKARVKDAEVELELDESGFCEAYDGPSDADPGL